MGFNVDSLVRALMDKLWTDIEAFVHTRLRDHHRSHEQFGTDPVKIPVGGLKDVEIDDDYVDKDGYPKEGDVLTYVRGEAEGHPQGYRWTNRPGVGAHEAVLTAVPGSDVPYGPINLKNKNSYIMAVNAISKGGAASGSATGIFFSLSGPDMQTTVDLRTSPLAWNPGQRLWIGNDLTGDATSVTVTWMVCDLPTTSD